MIKQLVKCTAILTTLVGVVARPNTVEYGFPDDLEIDRCTSIGAGPRATKDGSTMTTHNNDCHDCDIRVSHVPARDWPEGSKRPVFPERSNYPRYLERPEHNIHGPDYLIGSEDTSIFDFPPSDPMLFIDQVPHTYGYTIGTYGIQNEKQVSIGESTCAAVFYAIPIDEGGKAGMNMHSLTEIALERCDTARCACQIMGDMAVKYGFFGPESSGPVDNAKMEAGEAITVADPNEAWMFHVLPDDTGTSAVWIAQRVPDDHITAVANQFVIDQFDLDNTDYFMASSNIFEVAIRAGLWTEDSGKPFSFMKIYGKSYGNQGFMATRRVWRALTLAAPSLLPIFSAYTDDWGTFGFGADGTQPYPFSVKPDSPLTVTDVMAIMRDNYEGTDFDMTIGPDAGPFGDPMRYGPVGNLMDPVHGISRQDNDAGIPFGRAISLWRTAYSTVTQSRESLPDEVGALVWIAPYAPHHSSFVPIYSACNHTPTTMNTGTLFKFEKQSNFWWHLLTSNYVSKWYSYTNKDVRAFQAELEGDMFTAQTDLEKAVVKALSAKSGSAESKRAAALSMLEDHHEKTAVSVRDQWMDFFFMMVGKYRDCLIVDPAIKKRDFKDVIGSLSYPTWWLEQIGFWGAPGTSSPYRKPEPIRPYSVSTLMTEEAYEETYPNGFFQPYPDRGTPPPSVEFMKTGSHVYIAAIFLCIGVCVGVIMAKFCMGSNERPYSRIP